VSTVPYDGLRKLGANAPHKLTQPLTVGFCWVRYGSAEAMQ